MLARLTSCAKKRTHRERVRGRPEEPAACGNGPFSGGPCCEKTGDVGGSKRAFDFCLRRERTPLVYGAKCGCCFVATAIGADQLFEN